jgi:hypothetical protein
MEGISDIFIAGIDDTRPPKILKEPYIDLFFKLSHQAPEGWCKDFNELVVKMESSPKIDPAKGLIIATWVRTPSLIQAHLAQLKEKVAECTRRYIEKVAIANQASQDQAADTTSNSGPQGELNRIIAALNFSQQMPN